jgi:23S rRNA pseudouridine2605 synthase
MAERLQKYLARCGVGSRRACEKLIEQGLVSVDGVPAQLGQNVEPERQAVVCRGRTIVPPTAGQYWMLNKPVGYVTTVSDPQGRPTVMDLLPAGLERVFPVGRLDRDSQGLLLFTNDGELAQRLLHPSHKVWKAYHCGLKEQPPASVLRQLEKGVELVDGVTAPCEVRWLGDRLLVRLREGRKRQVRRMLGAVGYPVVWLRRVAFGGLELGDLPEGQCRALSAAEVGRLRE